MRYSNCWEDSNLLIELFKEEKIEHVFSIGSAGDNSLMLLTLNPKKVVVVDFSLDQIYLIKLKLVAIQNMEYNEILEFLGYKNNKNRLQMFNIIRGKLDVDTARYWEKNKKKIRNGVINCGRFEGYFNFFKKWLLPIIISKKNIDILLSKKTIDEQKNFYDKKINRFVWRFIFKNFFNKNTMSSLGRDKNFFKYVESSIEQGILQRTEYALKELPTDTNPYLEYIVQGKFNKNLPDYIKEENFKIIKENINKIEVFHNKAEEILIKYKDYFDCFNLSDIFEYMDTEYFEKIIDNIIDSSKNNAVLAYWNMQVDRISQNKSLFYDNERSLNLFKKDRAFFYKRFVVQRVTK